MEFKCRLAVHYFGALCNQKNEERSGISKYICKMSPCPIKLAILITAIKIYWGRSAGKAEEITFMVQRFLAIVGSFVDDSTILQTGRSL